MNQVDRDFSLDRLEHFAYSRNYESAAREMILLLESLDRTHGRFGALGDAPSGDFSSEIRDAHYATRVASALTALFSDPSFRLSQVGFKQIISFQRWVSVIFGASPFSNADHVIRALSRMGYEKPDLIELGDEELLKFCLLYSLDSSIPLQCEALWAKDKRLAGSLFVALLSSRVVASVEARNKREELLGWFPSRLAEISIDEIPVGILHDVWMHCSYAERADKHAVKRAINDRIRTRLLEQGLSDLVTDPGPARDRPVAMVITEWFDSTHAVYRTHSAGVEALRKRFYVVGVCQREACNEESKRCFDEVHVTAKSASLMEAVVQLRTLAEKLQPDLVYYLSVGMFPDTVLACNLRLAPIQMATWGHSASTFSAVMDYYLVESDLFGDPAVFSEKVVALPPGSLPYRVLKNAPSVAPRPRSSPDPVRIAIAASVMKLNPVFLHTLARIAREARVRTEYHIFSGLAFGLGKIYLQNIVRRFLPENAVFYPHLHYEAYLERLNTCDMFLSPFPFGNCNGIVDAVRQKLIGVCWTGPEIHSHIDEGLFRRLGLPDWTITRSVEEYVRAAIRLVEEHALRERLGLDLRASDCDAILTSGDPDEFVDAVAWVYENHESLIAGDAKLLVPPGRSEKAGLRKG